MNNFIKVFEKNAESFENGEICVIENAVDVCVTQNINGDYTLTFSLNPADEKYIFLENERICYILGQAYRIKVIEKERVSCEHIYTDASRCHIQATSSDDLIGYPAYTLMQYIFDKAEKYGFVKLLTPEEVSALGMEYVSYNPDTGDMDIDKMDMFVQSKVTPVAALKTLMESYDKYKIHTELYVDNRNIALVKQIGKDTDVVITLRENAKGIAFSKDSTTLVTRLYPYGKEDLHIGSVNSDLQYIDSDIKNEFGVYEGFMQFDDIDSAEELLKAGKKQFESENPDRIDVPKYTVTIEAVLTDEEIGLGDTVTVVDELGIHTRQRVISREIYPFEPQRDKLVVGTPPKSVTDTFTGLIEGAVRTEISTNGRGEVKTSWLEMMQKNVSTTINENLKNKEIALYKTGALFEGADESGNPCAVALIDGKLAIASEKDETTKDWIWTSIMDSGKVVVNEVFTGKLYTDRLTILGGSEDDTALSIKNNLITITDGNYDRVEIGKDSNSYKFILRNSSGSKTFEADENGDLTLCGTVDTGNLVIDENGIRCYRNGELNGLTAEAGDNGGNVVLYVDGNPLLTFSYMRSEDNGLLDFDSLYISSKGEGVAWLTNVNGTPKLSFACDVSFDGNVDFKDASSI